MANQVGPGTMDGMQAAGTTRQDAAYVGQEPGSPVAPRTPYHGRPVSWVAVSTIMLGFLVGGVALTFGHHGPTWWLFWLGTGLAVVGGLLALATGIFEDWY